MKTFRVTDFWIDERQNRGFIIIAFLGSLISFGIFKYFYPFANYINGDSYAYITMAYNNPKIGIYPIGYPMFLRLFSVFSKSDLALVLTQYIVLQLSLLYLVLTIYLFYKPANITRILLLAYLLFNPINLYLSNYISSDSLFLAMSIIWFVQLVHILHGSSNSLIFWNAIILVVLFMIRYNALFYPFVILFTFFLTREKMIRRVLALVISLVLIILFIRYTSNDYYRLSGYRQFSPFSGWQMANNALYSYRYVDKSRYKSLPKKFEKLDRMVRNYFDSTRDVNKYPSEALIASTVYMWSPNSPLNLYADTLMKGDTTAGPLKKWATAAPILNEYGIQLIKNYPKEFFNHYIIPNSIKYYAPPIEFLGMYNGGIDTVSEMAKIWFNYKNRNIFKRVENSNITTLEFYPIIVGTMNVLLILNIISFFYLELHKKYTYIVKLLVLIFALWMMNFSFSVFASPIALRFQMFPIIIYTTLVFLLMELLVKVSFKKSDQKEEFNGNADIVA